MTSSPPQGLAPVTTVHEETRAASGGAALTQQAEEANAVGTEEFATNRRGGKRKRDATQYYRLLSDEGKGVFQMFIEYCKRESIVTDGSVDQYARYASRYLYFLEQTTSAGLDDNGFVHQSAKRALTRSSNGTGSGPRSVDTPIKIKKRPPLPCRISFECF